MTPFEATLRRLRLLAPPSRTWVVSGRALAGVTRSALRRHRGVRLLVEPVARNTTAAIVWAAARVAAGAPEDAVGVFPADHHIPDPERFAATLRAAARAALAGDDLVLVGIEPTRPDTGYGYLCVRPRGSRGPLEVVRFVEKPDRGRARRFLRTGDHLWNAGMLVATPRRILEETRRHAPEVWAALGGVVEALAAGRRVPASRLAAAWRRTPSISFDYAVLERSDRVRAVRGRFGWSDLGSWDALAAHLPRAGGNRVGGTPPLVAIEAEGNVIWNTTGRPLALLGVEGLVVVATDDVLLVCRADRAQEVRRVVDELQRSGRKDLT